MKVVMKFGGTSLGSASRIRNAAQIVKMWSRENKVVFVVSALGTVTDELLELGEEARRGNLGNLRLLVNKIRRFHLETARRTVQNTGRLRDLNETMGRMLADLRKTAESIAQLRELTPRSQDYLLSFGERLSVAIVAATINDAGSKARAFTGGEAGVITDDNFGEARPLAEVSYHQVRERLEPVLARREIPVVTGFIATTTDGSIATLGRGGSDYTASLLGAAIGADEIWIWTDVDGLMTADPRIVKSARVLPRVSFGEARELSYFGAKMMHPRALLPASQSKIPVRIRNALRPSREGTLVTIDEKNDEDKVVRAVSIIRTVGIVTVEGSGMMGTPGVAAKVFQVLGNQRVNVIMISQGSSEATISCVVARKDVERAVRALQLALMGQGQVENVHDEKDVWVVAVVGAGMRGTPGVAARVFRAVARENANVRMIAQGSSEYNISFVVSESDGPKAVRAIHEEFELGER